MFSKLKHLKDLRNQAKTIQNILANESVEVEKGGIKIIMNGNIEVKSISINEELSKESMEGMLAECFNEVIKKAQRLMAQKMQEVGGLPQF